MLTHNLDTADGLTNGQLGILLAAIKNSDGNVVKLIIEFKNENIGANNRKSHPNLSSKYPKGTVIEKVSMSYKLTKELRHSIFGSLWSWWLYLTELLFINLPLLVVQIWSKTFELKRNVILSFQVSVDDSCRICIPQTPNWIFVQTKIRKKKVVWSFFWVQYENAMSISQRGSTNNILSGLSQSWNTCTHAPRDTYTCHTAITANPS